MIVKTPLPHGKRWRKVSTPLLYYYFTQLPISAIRFEVQYIAMRGNVNCQGRRHIYHVFYAMFCIVLFAVSVSAIDTTDSSQMLLSSNKSAVLASLALCSPLVLGSPVQCPVNSLTVSTSSGTGKPVVRYFADCFSFVC